jgi:peptidoglycan/LPS O-acetylase OafA/YrhL
MPFANLGQRIPGLDGLRGIAILLVIFSHVLQTYHWNQTVPFVWRIALGPTGVTLFFVLSGYLITALLLREHNQHGRISVAGFYRRRFYRIAPAFLVYLAIIATLAYMGVVAAKWLDFAASLAFVANYAHLPWVLLHTWSLSVEQQFYLLYPLLLLWGLRQKTKRPLLVVLVVTLFIPIAVRWLNQVSGVWPIDAAYSSEGRADALAYGCLCSIFQRHGSAQWQRSLQAGALPLAMALAAIAIALPVGTARILLHNSLMGLATALALYACTIHPGLWLTRTLDAAPLRAFGLISYSLYLWQQLWMTPALHIPLQWALVGAIVSGTTSFWLVERQFLNPYKRL